MFPVLPYGASFLTRAFNAAFEPERNLGTHVEPLCNLSFFFFKLFRSLSLSLCMCLSICVCLSLFVLLPAVENEK